MVDNRISQLFEQEIITIIGISRKESSLSYQVCKNLIEGGYDGRIQMVNPKAGVLFGQNIHKNINNLDIFGLVLIFLRFDLVVGSIREIAVNGGKFFIIYSSGFAEMEDSKCQKNIYLQEVIAEYQLTVIGPNCMGIIDTHKRLFASNWFYATRHGSIALVSQSGAYGMILSYMANNRGLGFSKFISVGNCINVDFGEILNYLCDDNATKFIVLYVEGIKDGRGFLTALKKVAAIKRVYIIKSGNTAESTQATISHTGSVGVDIDIFKAICNYSEAILADNIEELINSLYLASCYEMIDSNRITVISPSGGPCTVAADRCEKYGLELTKFSVGTTKKLKDILPPFASINNPVDVTTLTTNEEAFKAIEVILHDVGVQTIILMIFTDYMSTDFEKTILYILAQKKKLICITLEENSLRNEFERLHVPLYFSIDSAFMSIRNQLNYRNKKHFYNQYRSDGRFTFGELYSGIYNEEDTKKVLGHCEIKNSDEYIIRNEEDLAKYWNIIIKPVCLKVSEKECIHKTEINGVKKNIVDLEIAQKALKEWKSLINCGVKAILSRMRDGECQLYIDIKKDKDFGYIFIWGIGGVMINEINYRKVFIMPQFREQLDEILDDKLLKKFYNGFRNKYRIDRQKLLELIERLIIFVLSNEKIEEIEINPLMIDDNDLYIADALMIVG